MRRKRDASAQERRDNAPLFRNVRGRRPRQQRRGRNPDERVDDVPDRVDDRNLVGVDVALGSFTLADHLNVAIGVFEVE